MTTDTPGTTPDLDMSAPLDADQDVLCRVDYLLDQDARRQNSVWLLFLSAEKVQLPVLVPIDDVPDVPGRLLAGNLCDVIADVLDDAAPGGSAVITLTRSGGEAVRDRDRSWFHALRGAGRERGTPIRMLCLATRSGVRQLTLDDAI